jgi:AcrR family transcriptional regulator
MSSTNRKSPREARKAAAQQAASATRAAAADLAAEVKQAAALYAKELTGERLREVTESLRAAREAAEQEGSIWVRPGPGARRARLTREEIAQAALALADAEGIEAVSMRRVAASLEVGTMSLYHYVRTKAELVELMNDEMLAEVYVPPAELPAQWRPALQAIATRTMATFRRHPWALDRPPDTPGPNALRHFEQCLEAVAGLDVDFPKRLEIIAMVDDYAFGFALRQVHDAREREERSEAALEAMVGYFESQISTGDYPQLEAVVRGAPGTREALEEFEALMGDEARFDRGLARLLDGIALDLEGRS